MENQIRDLAIQAELERSNQLTTLDAEKLEVYRRAAPVVSVFYFPQTSEFMQKYILHNEDFPSTEGRLNQACVECNTRLQRMATLHYEKEKMLLDLEELEANLDSALEDLKNLILHTGESSEQGSVASTSNEVRRSKVLVKRHQLDLEQKRYTLKMHDLEMQKSFEEFAEWEKTVSTIFAQLKAEQPDKNYRTLNDVGWSDIRVKDMSIKTERWAVRELIGQEVSNGQKVLTHLSENELLDGLARRIKDRTGMLSIMPGDMRAHSVVQEYMQGVRQEQVKQNQLNLLPQSPVDQSNR